MTQWQGREEVKQAIRKYGEDAKARAHDLALYWSAVLEAYAKTHVTWTDRTSNARQTLYSVVDQETGKITIFLSHGMWYGVFLEIRNAGRFAVILPTLEAHYEEIAASYRRLFS